MLSLLFHLRFSSPTIDISHIILKNILDNSVFKNQLINSINPPKADDFILLNLFVFNGENT